MKFRLWQTHRERKAEAERSREAGAQDEAALIGAYRTAFAGGNGTAVLADILRKAGIVQRTFLPGDDAMTAAWREGRRSLALEIIEMCNRDPEALLTMARTGDVAALFPDTLTEAP